MRIRRIFWMCRIYFGVQNSLGYGYVEFWNGWQCNLLKAAPPSGDSKNNFFRNFSRKKCREYVQHALVFVREPDSDTQHSNTKPNENLNYVFFREKINQCRISLRLFNLERVFLHFQAEKTHRVVSHEYINCGKNYAENTKNHFLLTWWIGNGDLSHCRDLPYVRHVVFFRLFPWINFRFVQNMPRDCKISWARWQMNFKCFCCLFFRSKNLGRRWRVWHAILVC